MINDEMEIGIRRAEVDVQVGDEFAMFFQVRVRLCGTSNLASINFWYYKKTLLKKTILVQDKISVYIN